MEAMYSSHDLEWTMGDRLRKAREAAGYRHKQKEFAALVDISPNTLRRYEEDGTVPKRHVLVAWSDFTGFPLEWLETGEAPDPHVPASQSTSRDKGHGRWLAPAMAGRPTRQYTDLRVVHAA